MGRYAPFLLYVATKEHEIEKQPSKSVVHFRYTRMIFRPVNHVDVLMFFDDHAKFRRVVQSFLHRAFGSAVFYTVSAKDDDDQVPGFCSTLPTYTVTFKRAHMIGFRFIRISQHVPMSKLMQGQSFDAHRVRYNFTTGEAVPDFAAWTATSTGVVQSQTCYLSGLAPTKAEIEQIRTILRDMQRYFRGGWTFVNYPKLQSRVVVVLP